MKRGSARLPEAFFERRIIRTDHLVHDSGIDLRPPRPDKKHFGLRMVLQYLGLNPISDDPAHPAEECAPQSDTFHRQSYITAIRTVDFRSDRYIIAPDGGPHIRLRPVFFSDRRFGPSANVGDTCIYSMGTRWFVPAARRSGRVPDQYSYRFRQTAAAFIRHRLRPNRLLPNHAPHERQLSGNEKQALRQLPYWPDAQPSTYRPYRISIPHSERRQPRNRCFCYLCAKIGRTAS